MEGSGSQATVTPSVHHRAMRCWTRVALLPALVQRELVTQVTLPGEGGREVL